MSSSEVSYRVPPFRYSCTRCLYGWTPLVQTVDELRLTPDIQAKRVKSSLSSGQDCQVKDQPITSVVGGPINLHTPLKPPAVTAVGVVQLLQLFRAYS